MDTQSALDSSALEQQDHTAAFAAMLQLRETLEQIEQYYAAVFRRTGYFAAVSKETFFFFAVSGKESGNLTLSSTE